MHYVYFLRSLAKPHKTYVGMTSNLRERLQKHNDGGCIATSRYRPWDIVAYVAVRSQDKATELERYFKSGSGHAFWHKRFVE